MSVKADGLTVKCKVSVHRQRKTCARPVWSSHDCTRLLSVC